MAQTVPLPASFRRLRIAHRALHDRSAGRPENSRAAVRAAVAAGYGIEIDIQPSGDGVPMVFHDYDLHRLTGQGGRIRAHSARDLGAIRILDAEDGIPTLAEVLEIVAGRVPLLIEVKDQDGDMGPGVGPLEHAIAQVLAGYAGDVALMSFNPHSVAALAALAPGVARGITTSAYGEDWPLLSRAARDRLRGVFYGHVHQSMQTFRDGILYVAAPSTFAQFQAWPRDTVVNPDPVYPPAFNFVHMLPRQTIVHQHVIARPE